MNPETVHQQWLERQGAYSPRYYAYYGPDETSETLHGVLEDVIDPADRILEIGCSSGRHLAHLAAHGYTEVWGIDINEDAFEVMASEYPDLATQGRFFCDAIENVLPDFDDQQFEAVYSVETLQHIPRSNEWIFEEIARITADVLITAEIEQGTTETSSVDDVNYVAENVPLYYRDWRAVFTAYGFTQTDQYHVGQETIRVFRRA